VRYVPSFKPVEEANTVPLVISPCSRSRTVDAVDFDKGVATGRTSPFGFLSEMERRAGGSIKRLFGITVGTVVTDFEAHTPNVGPWCVKILGHPGQSSGRHHTYKLYFAI